MDKSYSYVVLIETAGNQRTIFATNRLRENIGASELIHRVGTGLVPEARAKVIAQHGLEAEDVLPLVEASGKAILLTRDEGVAEGIIEEVTERAAAECPGVTARGVAVPINAWTTDALNQAIGNAHHRIAALAAELPAPVARFTRLPFVENCAASGYPAAMPDPDRNLRREAGGGAVSAVGLAKRAARAAAWRRIKGALSGIQLFERMDQFEDEELDSDWVGIVHADGNGLGQVFLDLKSQLPPDATPEAYCSTLKLLSTEIDRWSREAAVAAIKVTWPEQAAQETQRAKRGRRAKAAKVAKVPIIPVVLGGDDLTVICAGERAVRFAACYLKKFETLSREALAGDLGARLPKLAAQGFVAAAAGIAIVKPHFPFHRAYELAEQLTKSAKRAKKEVGTKENPVPCSALDFQVVFDTSGIELKPMRERMMAPGGEHLTMRPYVVTPLARLKGKPGAEWAERRHYCEGDQALQHALRAIVRMRDENNPEDTAYLPSSQAHALIEGLYQGRAIADGRLRQIEHRYALFDWGSLTVTKANTDERSLFLPDGTETNADGTERDRLGAYLLDAMELADLGGEDGLDTAGGGTP